MEKEFPRKFMFVWTNMKVISLIALIFLARGFTAGFSGSVTGGVGDVKFIKVGETRYGLTRETMFGFNLNGEACYRMSPWYAAGILAGWSNFSEITVTGKTSVLDIYKIHLQNRFRFHKFNQFIFSGELGMGLDLLNLYRMDRDSRIKSSDKAFSLRPGIGVSYYHLVIKVLYNSAFFKINKPLDWMEFNAGFEF